MCITFVDRADHEYFHATKFSAIMVCSLVLYSLKCIYKPTFTFYHCTYVVVIVCKFEVWCRHHPSCTPPHVHLVTLSIVLAGLQQKKVLTPQDVMKLKEETQYMLLNLILDHSRKSPEDVATTADVLDTFGCKKEAAMLKCKLNGACVYITKCSYCTGSAIFVQ